MIVSSEREPRLLRKTMFVCNAAEKSKRAKSTVTHRKFLTGISWGIGNMMTAAPLGWQFGIFAAHIMMTRLNCSAMTLIGNG
jgi:hypothetical protein